MRFVFLVPCFFVLVTLGGCHAEKEIEKGEALPYKIKKVFMLLPRANFENEHPVFRFANVSLIEDEGKFIRDPSFKGAQDDLEKATYGIVFLNKRLDNEIPNSLFKRNSLFATLDDISDKDGVNHWYIFQLKSSDYSVIGVYGDSYQPEMEN